MAASQRCAKHNSFWIVWLFLLASRRLLILNLGQSKWKNDGLMKCISTEGPICGGFGGWFCVSPLKEGRGSGLSQMHWGPGHEPRLQAAIWELRSFGAAPTCLWAAGRRATWFLDFLCTCRLFPCFRILNCTASGGLPNKPVLRFRKQEAESVIFVFCLNRS